MEDTVLRSAITIILCTCCEESTYGLGVEKEKLGGCDVIVILVDESDVRGYKNIFDFYQPKNTHTHTHNIPLETE